MNFSTMYCELWRNFQSVDKLNFILLCFLAIIMSILEVVSISSILPFVSIVLGLEVPEILDGDTLLGNLYRQALKIGNLSLLLGFATIIVTTAVVRLATVYLNTTFSFKLGNKLCGTILGNTLALNYEEYEANHTSHYVNGIYRKTGVLMQNVILGTIQIIGNVLVVAIISAALFQMYGITTLKIISFIVVIYILIIVLAAPFTRYASEQAALQTTRALQTLGEVLGSFAEIRINSRRAEVVSGYKKIDFQFRKAEAQSLFISQAPRYIIEPLVIIFLAIYIYLSVATLDDPSSLIFVLTTIVIAMQKLLPYAQQIYSAIIGLRVNKTIFEETTEMLAKNPFLNETQSAKTIAINKTLKVKDLSYKRISAEHASLELAAAEIKIGTWTVIIGETGSGKSTLVNILLGLLKPTDGVISIDGTDETIYGQESWFSKVSFVDQRPFFPNVTIRQMVTGKLDQRDVDDELLQQVLSTCILHDTINKNSEKLDFMIGENANRLSGGQRQRLAVARALYNQKPILLLDEATNALDEPTQNKLLTNLKFNFPQLTVIMVAHRAEILPFFDNTINLNVTNR